MATPYSNVYMRFLPKIKNYDYLNLTSEEIEDNLETYLMSALVKFRKCKQDLSSRDEVLRLFSNDLSDEEQEILAILMIVEYLSPKIVTDELLKQSLSSKDWKLYSQANQIKEVRELRDMFKREVNQLMTYYSYSDFGDKL